jgi:hypothetical protein
MQLYSDIVTDTFGNGQALVEVLVKDSNGNTATIFDTAGTPKINPFVTDSKGQFSFKAADGNYTLAVGSVQQSITLFDTLRLPGSTALGINTAGLIDGAVITLAGRSAASDGGGGTFYYSASSAQTADNGLVFAPAGGGRLFRLGWTVLGFNGPVYPEWFGAVGDGNTTATDDHAAFQAAHDALAAFGFGEIRLAKPCYAIAAQLNWTGPVRIEGFGWQDVSTAASVPTNVRSCLKWTGSNSSTEAMIRVKSSTANAYIWNFGINRVLLDGNNKAYRGLWISSGRYTDIGRLWAYRCRDWGMVVDDGNGVLGGAFMRGDQYTYFAGANSATASSGGLKITSTTAAGCTGIHITSVSITTVNGDGLDIGDCDNSLFDKVFANPTGTGKGVRFRGASDGQTRPARKNVIGYFSVGTIYVEDTSRNVCEWVNSESTSITFAGTNGALHYQVIDRNDGRRWRTRSYLTGDSRKVNIASGFAPAGSSAALATNGGIDVRMVSYPNTGDNDFQWCEPPVSEWSGGKITSVRLWYVKSSSTHEGNVSLTVGVKVKGLNSGIGGAFVSLTQIVATDAAGTNTYNVATFTFGSPITYSLDDQFIVNIKRNKASDVLDTYTDAVGVTAFEVSYLSNTGNSDSPSYRYGDSAQKVS